MVSSVQSVGGGGGNNDARILSDCKQGGGATAPKLGADLSYGPHFSHISLCKSRRTMTGEMTPSGVTAL